ncbi:Autophagocytosis associated protein [Plasmodiophora brassicae]|uniref:Uncharacterized protein n=1 Tax=Plasmodiophora brassicae TaxID=37360 RepID=A0A3P3YDB1_PLABS|nr:unnamed protein product [Plasmodiophora brassicae]
MAMNFIKGVAEYWTPVLSTSQFLEKGVLTPEEFVIAGDELVRRCPSWAWGTDTSRTARPFLPTDKQYLITRNVPSMRRADAYAMESAAEEVLEQTDADADGWVATHTDRVEQDIPDIAALDLNAPEPDIQVYEEDDPYALDACEIVDATNVNVIRTRTYDLTISYDKYYQTPRMWLFGYDENRNPLSPEQVMEDISSDHAHKTVTVESHPHITGISCASIHPCKHASVVKTMMRSSPVEVTVSSYMFLFLKFIQGVIPTIEYDFTPDVNE